MTKTAIVTGATGAIGKAIARQLAALDYTVVLAVRNPQKAKQAVDEIQRATRNEKVRAVLVDLGRESQIRSLAKNWQGPLHVLVNNASITPRSREETPEGIERQWAVNVLGYFWMMDSFDPILRASAPARIVNVASYWAGGMDLSDPERKKRSYNNGDAYRQSKQAERMLTAAFAERLRDAGVTVNACHPGDVNSSLSNNLGFGGHESPDTGARTPVWLATSPELEGVTGKYYEHMRESHCSFMQNHSEVEALYKMCRERGM